MTVPADPTPEQGSDLRSAQAALEGTLTNGFFGVQDPAPEAETPAALEAPAPEEPVETEEVAPDNSLEEVAEPVEPGEPPEEPTEPVNIETLSQWADAVGVSVDDILAMRHQVKADGEVRDVPLSDLIQGYQKGTNYETKVSKLAEQRKALDAAEAQRNMELQQSHQRLAEHLLFAEQKLYGELQAKEQAVRSGEEDAEDFYRLKLSHEESLRQIAQTRQHANQQYQQEQMAAAQKHLAREQEILTDLVPNWGDETASQVKETLEELRFTPQEIGSISDHRFIVMALRYAEASKELAAFKAKQAEGASLAEKIKREVPVASKASKPSTQAQRISAEHARLFKQVKSGGGKNMKDVAALIASKHSKVL